MKKMHKVLLILAGGLTVATTTPAFARHDRDDDRRHSKRHYRVVEIERRYVPVRQVIVQRPVFVRRVYVEQPVYVRPEPTYYAYPVAYRPAPASVALDVNWGTVGGTVAGAVIGSRFGKGDGRIATTAVGAVVGGMVGSHF